MAEKRNPGALAGATGAGMPCYAIAAGTPSVTQTKRGKKLVWCYIVSPEHGEPFTIHLKGRDAWALDRLREAGPKGCTPITEPAPRWSAYVYNLRGLGVPIETVTEPHGGNFAGHHARYVLRAVVQNGGAA